MSSNALRDYLECNLNFRHFARRNGRIIDKDGYALRSKPDHPFADCKGYVREHRLIWEYYNHAILLPWTGIHHINENKSDNRIENLKPVHQASHVKLHMRKLREIVFSKRICIFCGSNKTLEFNRRHKNRKYRETLWYFLDHDKNKPICARCYGIRRRRLIRNSKV